MEENALKEIIPKAWAVAESKLNKKHVVHHPPQHLVLSTVEEDKPAKKPLIKSQNTILEEQ